MTPPRLRLVSGLRWARAIQHPAGIPKSRPRRGSAKRDGLRYEASLREALGPEARSQWFEFEDDLGRSVCQVDVLMAGSEAGLVLEAKLTWVPEAQVKLAGLYLPVARMALGLPVDGLVVCRNLRPEVRTSGARIEQRLDGALYWARRGQPAVLHWLGAGHPILALQRRAA